MSNEVPNSQVVTPSRVLLFAFCCAALTANLYYMQPLTALLASSFAIPLTWAGYLVTSIQVGYVIGVVFIVPLSDVVDRRRLLTAMLACNVASLLLADRGGDARHRCHGSAGHTSVGHLQTCSASARKSHYGLHCIGLYRCIRGIVFRKYCVRHARMVVDMHCRCDPACFAGRDLADPGQSRSAFVVLKMSWAMAMRAFY
jgi:hypothetical protein